MAPVVHLEFVFWAEILEEYLNGNLDKKFLSVCMHACSFAFSFSEFRLAQNLQFSEGVVLLSKQNKTNKKKKHDNIFH